MSTHNICFYRETRKILCGHHFLSVAMDCAEKSDGTVQLYNKIHIFYIVVSENT